MANLMLNDAARVALAVLFNSLWQGALIALVAWGVLRVFPRANAATRYAIWAFALVAMIVSPIVTSLPRVSVEAAPAAQKHHVLLAAPQIKEQPEAAPARPSSVEPSHSAFSLPAFS